MSRNSSILLLLPVLLMAGGSDGAGPSPRLPDAMHALALSSVDHVYKEEFKEARDDARRMMREYPDHPAGYFFMAAVIDARMEHLQTDDEEVDFYRHCDLAVSKGEALLEKRDDPWVRFFVGGAHGARGTYESRYGRWITAFRFGWQGVTAFRELLEQAPGIKDAWLGIATYDYWRSAMTKKLWWMPGVEDKRDEAIGMLREVVAEGIYVREAAAKNLVPILNNEKRYREALAAAEGMLARYPNCLVFKWGRAEAKLGLGEPDAAEKEFKQILERVESQDVDNRYNVVRCRYFLARTYFRQKHYARCRDECRRIQRYELDTDTKRRLEKE
ncbi:MAG: hypothetical protein GF418_08765, partial [Chitinivibrionales bacterium]|nr:hypothetical protein [Chitinivibrionales bacterium]MBD3395704.1 hypothetical protein [Chitinivibrionales bacterium]